MFVEEIKELMKKLIIQKNELKRVGEEYVRLNNEIKKVEKKIEKLKEMTDIEEIELVCPEPKLSNTRELNQKINKWQAIEIVNTQKNKKLNSRDVVFSNRNESTGQWWFEPNIKKFEKTLYIILNDRKTNKLYLFKIPENNYLHPEEKFYYRKDRSSSSITIDGNDTHKFRDTLGSGVCFSEFLEDIIAY